MKGIELPHKIEPRDWSDPLQYKQLQNEHAVMLAILQIIIANADPCDHSTDCYCPRYLASQALHEIAYG